MKNLSSSYNFNGITVTNTWINSKKINDFKPITQVYGIIFNRVGEILICREKPKDKWQIPGGSPENAETAVETLERELEEEVSVKIRSITPIGVQKVEMPGNSNKEVGDIFYQARFVALLDKTKKQTPDPDRKNVWERIFVPPTKIKKYVKWGIAGNAMFDDAIDCFRKINK